MRTRAPLIVLAILAVTAAVFCFRAWDKKSDANEESPAVVSLRSFWLNAAHHSICQVEGPLIRSSLLLRLLPYCVRARDTTLALEILEKVEDKASAHAEYAVAARQNHDMAAYQKHMDAAFEIADATREDGSYVDDRGRTYRGIASTLIKAGFVRDAVSLSSRVDVDNYDGEPWETWQAEKVRDLASEGRIADARCIAAAIPSEHRQKEAYVDIAEIQRDDGDGPGATETLQEAIALVDQSDSPVDKAYYFSLIAAAFAQNGDRTEAVDARARCHQALTAVDTSLLQESDDMETAARTYAKLAHASAHLGESEEAKRGLAQADSILAKMADDRDNYENEETVIVIAEVWMCLNEQDKALAVAATLSQSAWDSGFLRDGAFDRVITHPSFSATPEVIGRILAGLPDDFARDFVLLFLVIHHLDHGRVAQAQVLAETIDESVCRSDADDAIFDKLCELGAIDQVIDMLPRGGYDADRALRKLCELASIEQAIDIAARIGDPQTEIEVFQLVGKRLAKSRPIAEFDSFLTAQSKPIRLSAAYLGVLEALITDAESNDHSQTDGDSAAPSPDQ